LPGYAIDDGVAVHFRHGQMERVVSKRSQSTAYYVSMQAGIVKEQAIDATVLL